jgi:hypothetical protein
MITQYVAVQQVLVALEKLKQEAHVLDKHGKPTTSLWIAIKQIEQALQVDPDMRVDRETARRATGLSDRALDRRGYTGRGRGARFRLGDLIGQHADQGPDEREPEPTTASSFVPVPTMRDAVTDAVRAIEENGH